MLISFAFFWGGVHSILWLSFVQQKGRGKNEKNRNFLLDSDDNSYRPEILNCHIWRNVVLIALLSWPECIFFRNIQFLLCSSFPRKRSWLGGRLFFNPSFLFLLLTDDVICFVNTPTVRFSQRSKQKELKMNWLSSWTPYVHTHVHMYESKKRKV
jgi:hypothetical protein